MQTVFRLACAIVAGGIAAGAQTQSTPQFRAGVEVVHLNIAVVDSRGRLVSGLGAEDFAVYEDGEPRPLVHFSTDPAPVSLGILVDSSVSMRDDPQKLAWVRSVIGGLLNRSSPEDQVFVFEFWLGRGRLLQPWTTDRDLVVSALGRLGTGGERDNNPGTSRYDAVSLGLEVAGSGVHRQKAMIVVSDGLPDRSEIRIGDLQDAIRASDVSVFGVAMAGSNLAGDSGSFHCPPNRFCVAADAVPFLSGSVADHCVSGVPCLGPTTSSRPAQFFNYQPNGLLAVAEATGGRTHVVQGTSDIDAVGERLAAQLGKQYSLAYESAGEFPEWRRIHVEVLAGENLRALTRGGYLPRQPATTSDEHR